jgi:hypothetical protein
MQCCGIGWGFPCKVEPTFERECDGCHKTFRNANCFKRHLDRNICDIFKRCQECGHFYRVKDKPHVCYTSRCQQCSNYHREDEPCFVQPIRSPAQRKDFLMVYLGKKCQKKCYMVVDYLRLRMFAGFANGKCRGVASNCR